MSKKFGALLLVIGLCLLIPGWLLLCQVQDGYQYTLPAGNLSESYPQAVQSVDGLDAQTTISARKQGISLMGTRAEISLTLYAVDEMYPAICHETLKQGRTISAGDVAKSRRVMVIDETTAFALFNGGEAMGKTLRVADVDWEIVGIVADKSRFGEADESVAFVPISAALSLNMDTLEIRVTGIRQAVIVESALNDSSGSFVDLSREKYAALMPIRWAVIVVALLLAMWLLKQTVPMGKQDLADYRQRLTRHYPRELTGWFMGRLAVLLLMGTAAGLSAFAAMKLLTSPALVFTDWIPENPVSLSDYIERFWVIHRENARAIHYTSREMSMVELSAWLIRWGMFAVLGGATIRTTRRKPK